MRREFIEKVKDPDITNTEMEALMAELYAACEEVNNNVLERSIL